MKCLALLLGLLAACSTDTFTGPDGAFDDARTEGSTGDSGPTCQVAPACPAKAQCSGFDDANQSLGTFVNISQNGGNVTFVSDLVVTCPYALAAFCPASASTSNAPRGAIGATAQITAVVTTHARLELDVIFPKTLTGAATFLFMYPNTDVNDGVGVIYTGSWLLHDGVTNDDVSLEPKTGEWNHVALDVTFAQSDNIGALAFTYTDKNGQLQTAKLSKSTLDAGVVPTVSAINFGAGVLPFGTTSGPMVMHIDDVIFSPF